MKVDIEAMKRELDAEIRKLPLRERLGIYFFRWWDWVWWRVADLVWKLFRYDMFDGQFVNNLEPDPQCDAEYAAGQYEEYNNIDDFLASFEDDK